MDIKEIALKVADSLRNKVDGISHMQSNQGLVAFAEALISAYKAELLNEVGEPVAVTNHAQLGYVTDGMHPDIPLAMWAKETSYSGANIALYTSDQVAAAILKATKPLEERRCEVCGYAEHHREHTGCLRKQVFSLKAELREICAAIDDPACDPTLTAVECIKKLKAENESLKRDAERLDFILRKQLIVIQDCDDKYLTYNAQSGKRGPEMDSEAEAIDAAMLSQGEQK